MNIREANTNTISLIPGSEQENLNEDLSNRHGTSLFRPLSADEIYSELADARECYKRGEYKDFDDALDEINKKYGLL